VGVTPHDPGQVSQPVESGHIIFKLGEATESTNTPLAVVVSTVDTVQYDTVAHSACDKADVFVDDTANVLACAKACLTHQRVDPLGGKAVTSEAKISKVGRICRFDSATQRGIESADSIIAVYVEGMVDDSIYCVVVSSDDNADGCFRMNDTCDLTYESKPKARTGNLQAYGKQSEMGALRCEVRNGERKQPTRTSNEFVKNAYAFLNDVVPQFPRLNFLLLILTVLPLVMITAKRRNLGRYYDERSGTDKVQPFKGVRDKAYLGVDVFNAHRNFEWRFLPNLDKHPIGVEFLQLEFPFITLQEILIACGHLLDNALVYHWERLTMKTRIYGSLIDIDRTHCCLYPNEVILLMAVRELPITIIEYITQDGQDTVTQYDKLIVLSNAILVPVVVDVKSLFDTGDFEYLIDAVKASDGHNLEFPELTISGFINVLFDTALVETSVNYDRV
jgi:hypothetical protein